MQPNVLLHKSVLQKNSFKPGIITRHRT